jgi:hypothetical protein
MQSCAAPTLRLQTMLFASADNWLDWPEQSEAAADVQYKDQILPRYHFLGGLFRLRRYMPVRDWADRWPIARFPPATALPDCQPLPFEPPQEEPRCRT